MDAKDLRIGNWVTDEFYDSFKTIFEVESINDKGINLSIQDDGKWGEIADRWIEPEYEFELLFGIPVTEEHLFKFGFDKLENDIPTYFKCFGSLIEDDYEYSFNIYVDSEQNYFLTVFGRKIIIKYIHQLQNLYFTLTEKELTIKL
jgi:hypothetical protein